MGRQPKLRIDTDECEIEQQSADDIINELSGIAEECDDGFYPGENELDFDEPLFHD